MCLGWEPRRGPVKGELWSDSPLTGVPSNAGVARRLLCARWVATPIRRGERATFRVRVRDTARFGGRAYPPRPVGGMVRFGGHAHPSAPIQTRG